MAIPYNSNYDLTIPFSDVSAQFALVAGSFLTFTVPGPETINYAVRFAYTQDSSIFVRLGDAPTIPGSNTVTDEQYSEFKPGFDGTQRYVKGGDVLYFQTTDTAGAYMGITLRQLP